MTVWQCPKCGWSKDQPACVTGITHRCKPTIPRAVRLAPVPQLQEETPT